MPLPVALALAGFLIVHVPMFYYFTLIGREKVPVSVLPYNVAMVLGVALGLGGIIAAPALATGVLGGFAVAMGAFFLWLMSMRKLPDGTLIAKLGEPLPELSAPDQDGQLVRLADLRGQRVMLNFFRGSW